MLTNCELDIKNNFGEILIETQDIFFQENALKYV